MVPGTVIRQAPLLMRLNGIRCAGALSFWAMMAVSLPARSVDIVPMAGFRFGGQLSASSDPSESDWLTIGSAASYGGAVDFPLPSPYGLRAVELYFSRQQTTLGGGQLLSPPVANLDISVLHLGLADTVPTDDPHLSWLLIGTFGATRFETAAGGDTRPSVGLGGAVVWMGNPHVGLRGDLRALVSFTGNSTTVLACNGGCSYFYAGSIVVQGEASIGVVLRFR